MNDCLPLIGRSEPLFAEDMATWDSRISEQVRGGSFLVVGGAGSIGQAVVKELFRRSPRRLYVVDISENNMVELVRDLRSSLGYIRGDFRTFILDCGSREFDVFLRCEGPFDYILNLSALKHVRSERDPYTLMRMVEVNILNTNATIHHATPPGDTQVLLRIDGQGNKPREHDGGLEADHGTLSNGMERAYRRFHRPLCQRGVLRWQSSARLLPADRQTTAAVGAA
jgi:hypothetical protein